MNPNYPDLIYNGIIICLCLQLIILGVIKIFSKDTRDIILGFLCLFLASGRLYNLYWLEFNNSIFFNIIIGGQKSLFFGPLIFIYVFLVKKNITSRLLYYYLVPPIFLSLGYLIVKFGFKAFFQANLFYILNTFYLIEVLFLGYLLLKKKQLFKSIKGLIKPEIYKRYFIFYVGLSIIFLCSALDSFIFSFFNRSSEQFISMTRYIYNPIEMISKGGLVLFAFLESKRIKSFVFGKNIYAPNNSIKNEKAIHEFIDKSIYNEKLFLNSDFNLKEALRQNGILEKEFKIYIKKNYKKTFTDFINDLKVEEFKVNILDPKNKVFDIASIAEMSGFKSKATFYRIFKDKEGITPQQYQRKMTL